jgi:hypothetical protein
VDNVHPEYTDESYSVSYGPWNGTVHKTQGQVGEIEEWRFEVIRLSWRVRQVGTECFVEYAGDHCPYLGLDDGPYRMIIGHCRRPVNETPQPHSQVLYGLQRYHRYFDPPSELPGWSMAVAESVVRGDLVSAETKWMETVPGVKSFVATFNGDPYTHRQEIQTHDLAAGVHGFDFTAELDSGQSRRFQVAFSVIDRVSLAVDAPVVELPLRGRERRNGLRIPVRVQNNSGGDVLVRLQASVGRAGWVADLVGESAAVLKAKKQKRFQVQVEIMNNLGVTRQPIPITVEATYPLVAKRGRALKTVDARVSTTVNVQLAGSEEEFAFNEQLNRGVRRSRLPLLYGSSTPAKARARKQPRS